MWRVRLHRLDLWLSGSCGGAVPAGRDFKGFLVAPGWVAAGGFEGLCLWASFLLVWWSKATYLAEQGHG